MKKVIGLALVFIGCLGLAASLVAEKRTYQDPFEAAGASFVYVILGAFIIVGLFLWYRSGRPASKTGT
jgi:hypothetical protein